MTDGPTYFEKRRLQAHFGFARLPFAKSAQAAEMFDSQSQRELLAALQMWTEVTGIALVTGPTGVGKSITLRRFVQTLDPARFHIVRFAYLPTTLIGFLRSLNRELGLAMRLHATDLFDQAQKHLGSYQPERGARPLLLIDDAEGLRPPVLDAIRRLTAFELDGPDRFHLLLAGTEDLLTTLQHPELAPLRSRVSYAHPLRPFGLEDARNYVRHHLQLASADPKLFSDDAVRRLFLASRGQPRSINQLATQALICAAVAGRDALDGEFVGHIIAAHPLYPNTSTDNP